MLGTVTAVPVLPSRDLERSAKFYARLGYAVAVRYPDYVILARDGAELHLAAIPVEPEANPAGLYLRVEGVDRWAAEFGALAEERPWGQREFAIGDPDGNLLRFSELVVDGRGGGAGRG